jgi:hypothetical protein
VRVLLVGERRKLRGDGRPTRRASKTGVAIATRPPRSTDTAVVDAPSARVRSRRHGTAAAAIRRINPARPSSRIVSVDPPST